jgi:hypothetical protein
MTLEELEKKVRELEDKDEIKSLHREYLFYISNLEFDKALECFTDNISVDIADYEKITGKDKVAQFFNDVIYQNVLQSKDAHFTVQPVISLNGDKAKGYWMFYRLFPKPRPDTWVQGRYDCEYKKENGKWKFSTLQLTRPWPKFFESN